MTEYEELTKRLRNFFDPVAVDFTLIEQAATAIEALTAENARLRETVDYAKTIDAENVRLTAEVERLKEAERWIPVSIFPERPTPKYDGKVVAALYLVRTQSGCAMTAFYNFDGIVGNAIGWQDVGTPITHWKPLPSVPEGV